VATTSYYFAWYLAQAFAHAGRADAYLGLLNTWRDLLKFHYTTWPEERGDTRTDSHAWSAHPSADLLGLVAGIQPGAPGYAKVRIAPAPATLRSFDARAATPSGAVRVRYRKQGGVVTFTVDRPVALPGDLHWRGRSYPLTTAHTVIRAR
jgi:hypothetical protein